MIKYVLVAVIQVYGGNQLTMYPFASKDACEAAKLDIVTQLNNVEAGGKILGHSVTCVEDAEPSFFNPPAKTDTPAKLNDKQFKTTDDLPVH